MSDPNEQPELDLEAWEPQLPPADFAERVLTSVRAEPPRRKPRRRPWAIAGGAIATLAIAAALAVRIGGEAASHG